VRLVLSDYWQACSQPANAGAQHGGITQ
jgi:hypothetical protein